MEENQTIETAVLGENTVSQKEFDTTTKYWSNKVRQNKGVLDNIILAEHFDIPLCDIQNLVNEMKLYNQQVTELTSNTYDQDKVTSIRAFVGSKLHDESNNAYQMDLYLTGVKRNGEPINNFEGKSAIYDFILPCPPTCVKEGGALE